MHESPQAATTAGSARRATKIGVVQALGHVPLDQGARQHDLAEAQRTLEGRDHAQPGRGAVAEPELHPVADDASRTPSRC